jgi:hypothetical protein
MYLPTNHLDFDEDAGADSPPSDDISMFQFLNLILLLTLFSSFCAQPLLLVVIYHITSLTLEFASRLLSTKKVVEI